jgi:hypothetical protein
MDDDITKPTDEDILTCDVSDEALEAAVGTAREQRTMATFVDRPGCGGTC